MPLPPNVNPDDVDGLVGAHPCELPSCDPLPALELQGEVGSVANPEGATIWVVNLDGVEPPVTAPVEPDGSFNIIVDGDIDVLQAGGLSEEYRLQVRTDDDRSEPIDFVADLSQRTLQVSERPLAECFTIEPATELDFGSVSAPSSLEIILRNDCAEALTFEAVRLRAPTASFLAGTGPGSLDRGQDASVLVEFEPEHDGLLEEIMMVEASSPTRDRRPITLSGRGDSD
jgi:hypothetical protein